MKPLKKTLKAAQEFGEGKLESRILSISMDELGELSNCLNVSFQKIEDLNYENIKAIQKFNSQEFVLNSHCLVSVTDIKGKINFANDKFCKISQYSEKELLGNDHRLLNSGYHSKTFMKNIWETILAGDLWQGQICNKAKDGSLYWVNSSIAGYRDITGKISQLVAVRTDITAEKRLELKLKTSFEEAQEANAAKSQFLANMSHEIRTPLNSIIGYSDILIEDKLPDEQAHMMRSIQNSSETLLCLVNDILDLAKVESGELTLEEIPVNLEDILFEVAESMVAKITNVALEINVLMNDTYALAYSDPTRLKQIFTNLVGNSIKFTEKGEIVISVETLNENDTEIELRFVVRDTGIGISKEHAKIIFEPFKQADGSTTRKYGGTGLGLNITKQIIAKMNSEIVVESTVGEGSSFKFDLRLKKYFPDNSSRLQDLSQIQPLSILIVDDNLTAREIFSTYLDKIQVIHYSSASAVDALEILAEHNIDLAILDLMIPEVDGYALATIIKEKYPKIKLIAATADIRSETLPKVTKYGFDSYLRKPVRAIVLYKTILRLNANDTREEKLVLSKDFEHGLITARLLVVDDNPTNLKLAGKIFSKMGHSVDLANSGPEAIIKVNSKSYDIIFMDMQMPDMDGIEASKIIRQKDQNTVIVALTANAFEEDRKKCLDAGMNDFLTKPIRRKEVHKVIQVLLAKK